MKATAIKSIRPSGSPAWFIAYGKPVENRCTVWKYLVYVVIVNTGKYTYLIKLMQLPLV